MKEIFIHIGLHKTGTTFLQRKIFPNLNDFCLVHRERHANFPNIGGAINQFLYADESLYNSHDLKTIFESISEDKVIWTSEDLCGRPMGFGGVVNRAVIAKRIKDNFPNAKIIIAIRGQEQIIYSTYNQYLKGENGVLSIQKSLKKGIYEPKGLYIHLNTFKYYELIKFYKSLFSDVLIIKYEDVSENPSKVIHQIEEFMNTSIDPHKLNLARENVTPDLAKMQNLRFVNRWQLLFGMNVLTKVAWRMYKYLYVPLTGKGKNDKQYIHEFVGDYYHENNRKLAELCPELELENYKKYYRH